MVSKWIPRLTLLLLLACVGCTTVSVDSLDNNDCSDYVPPAMWAATPHAPPPGTSQASHAEFELGEAGQLEKANADKDGTHHIITVCEAKKHEAAARAKRQLEPWYKRIFG
jgi:hypothetical protein